jgi:hypothetical protein
LRHDECRGGHPWVHRARHATSPPSRHSATADTMQNHTDIYFLHIPKTTGSSLTRLMHDAYPHHERLPVFEWYELIAIESRRLQEYRCFAGHFGSGLDRLLDRRVPTVTLLRDPVREGRFAPQLRVGGPGRISGDSARVSSGVCPSWLT